MATAAGLLTVGRARNASSGASPHAPPEPMPVLGR